MTSAVEQFEKLVRGYLAGKVDWEAVHQQAIQMEWENKAEFPAEFPQLEELHLIFVTADSKDDPQFRADKSEISALISDLDQLRHKTQ